MAETSSSSTYDVIIVGAGVSGLTAAVYLRQKGLNILVLEATDRVGGRIKTDVVNGFRLDRGFQVLLTAYPEAKRLLDYEALDLCSFLPGAIILNEEGTHEIMDPSREVQSIFRTLFSKAGTLSDKMNMLSLKRKLMAKDLDTIFEEEEVSTLEIIQQYGFSEKMLRNFFQPFMAGIFLERGLNTSCRMFDFVFKMFASGDTAIPKLGMEEIPKQLAGKIGMAHIKTSTKVKSIDGKRLKTAAGEEFKAKHILLATAATDLVSTFIADDYVTEKQSVTCVYFTAPESPVNKPAIILNASQDRVVNNICVMNEVSEAYAPQGQSLISTSIIGLEKEEPEALAEIIRSELAKWYGKQTETWKFLKMYPIKYALPNQDSVTNEISERALRINDRLFVAGDFLLNGSINGAMKSGRLAAEAIMKANG